MDKETISKYISYNEVTGELSYKTSGRVCTCKLNGYIRVTIKKKQYYAHRIAWTLVHGECDKDVMIDHKNGNRADNRIENLRIATNAQNCANKLSKGFTKHRDKWLAKTKYQGKYVYIGVYECPVIAHMAHRDKMRELHGEFAHS